MKSHFCFEIFTSSDKIPVRVGVGHCSVVSFTVGSAVVLMLVSMVGSVVGSAFGWAVGSIGSEVTMTQIR